MHTDFLLAGIRTHELWNMNSIFSIYQAIHLNLSRCPLLHKSLQPPVLWTVRVAIQPESSGCKLSGTFLTRQRLANVCFTAHRYTFICALANSNSWIFNQLDLEF